MRLRLGFLSLLLFANAALAAGWTSYTNARFGLSIDVPPGFVNDVPEPANGDGLAFRSADGMARLLIWGNNVVDGDFNLDAAIRQNSDADDDWSISYNAGVDSWNVYSGIRSGRLLYVKSIASCKNTQALHFRLEYPGEQKKAYDPVIERLGKSLKAVPASDCP